jgi:hypothetical protein
MDFFEKKSSFFGDISSGGVSGDHSGHSSVAFLK